MSFLERHFRWPLFAFLVFQTPALAGPREDARSAISILRQMAESSNYQDSGELKTQLRMLIDNNSTASRQVDPDDLRVVGWLGSGYLAIGGTCTAVILGTSGLVISFLQTFCGIDTGLEPSQFYHWGTKIGLGQVPVVGATFGLGFGAAAALARYQDLKRRKFSDRGLDVEGFFNSEFWDELLKIQAEGQIYLSRPNLNSTRNFDKALYRQHGDTPIYETRDDARNANFDVEMPRGCIALLKTNSEE